VIIAIGPLGATAAALAVVLAVLAVAVLLLWRMVRARDSLESGPARRIDPFALQEPWRQYVLHAQGAQRRFGEAARTTRPGPLRDRLDDIGRRVGQAVDECGRIATSGNAIDGALRALDLTGIRSQLARLQAGGGDEHVDHVEQARAALLAQLASAERMTTVSADARARLRVLDARLDELVARALELGVGTRTAEGTTALGPADPALGSLDAGVDDVVNELEALRLAMDEVNRPGTA
jgi:hypothetical protein